MLFFFGKIELGWGFSIGEKKNKGKLSEMKILKEYQGVCVVCGFECAWKVECRCRVRYPLQFSSRPISDIVYEYC